MIQTDHVTMALSNFNFKGTAIIFSFLYFAFVNFSEVVYVNAI